VNKEQNEAYLNGMQLLEDLGPIIDIFAGMKKQIMAQGFTEQQAGDLVIEVVRGANLKHAKEARQ
jgi:hypothetical protein